MVDCVTFPAAASVPIRPGLERLRYRPIEDLDLPLLAYRCLKQQDIQTLSQLLSFSERQLMELPNFGAKSLAAVKKSLEELGLPALAG